jgi:MFS family permease
VIFLLLPFFAIRSTWVRLPRKGPSALFFAGLGFGFIFFEITLMQELNLFLGYPTYALTVTLMSLLVFTGLGALLSQVVVNRRRAIPRLLAAVAALCLFYLLGLTPLTNALFDLPLVGRIIIAFAVLAPLGICLGMFMPIGLGEIAQRGSFPREYVAWGWAVNGFASVVGSVLATILSMSFGFDFVLLMGLAAYLVAAGAWIALTRDHRAKELGRAANVLP